VEHQLHLQAFWANKIKHEDLNPGSSLVPPSLSKHTCYSCGDKHCHSYSNCLCWSFLQEIKARIVYTVMISWLRLVEFVINLSQDYISYISLVIIKTRLYSDCSYICFSSWISGQDTSSNAAGNVKIQHVLMFCI